MKNILSTILKKPSDRRRRRACAIPTRCDRSEGRSFNELMEGEWEELVIKFDNKKNDYVFKTACCAGAPAC